MCAGRGGTATSYSRRSSETIGTVGSTWESGTRPRRFVSCHGRNCSMRAAMSRARIFHDSIAPSWLYVVGSA